MNENISALTCPFCGGIPEVVYRVNFKEYFIKCTNNRCRSNAGIALDINNAHRTIDSAVNHWNKSIPRNIVSNVKVRRV